MKELALKKIEDELKTFKGSQHAAAVKNAVAEALKEFARQDDEFAQAIAQSDKTLSDCCAAVTAGVGGSISDLEAYRRAVQFYFPGADIRFHMTIDLCPSDGGAEDEKPSGIVLNLADFL